MIKLIIMFFKKIKIRRNMKKLVVKIFEKDIEAVFEKKEEEFGEASAVAHVSGFIIPSKRPKFEYETFMDWTFRPRKKQPRKSEMKFLKWVPLEEYQARHHCGIKNVDMSIGEKLNHDMYHVKRIKENKSTLINNSSLRNKVVKKKKGKKKNAKN